MGRDTIADIITSIRNADMDKKGTVRIASTNITENIVKILLREGFIENVRKHRESNKNFLVSTLGPSSMVFRRWDHNWGHADGGSGPVHYSEGRCSLGVAS
ncbi:hypothetical protein MKW94_014813 [Papaver nudicaule]|uniref:Small ribosomal subunit protein uS8c n=1 Tax=Papaver nudicaule TaxID=74823 RepID=A0AA41RQR5_PAPNU|nr:hypothetical protein [Papaver nudicaule]